MNLSNLFFENLIKFIHISSNLKTTLRSIQVAENRKESSAEHSWHLALLLMLIEPFLEKKINLEKALKMAIIHDLAEAISGDENILDLIKGDLSLNKIEKHKKELKIFVYFRELLGEKIGSEILSLWEEFEKNETYEAKTVNALDKLEAQIQQNESKLATWKEINETGYLQYLESFCDFDAFIKKFKDEIKLRRVQ